MSYKYFYNIFYFLIFWPIVKLLKRHPLIQSRFIFENLNNTDDQSISFNKQGLKANIAFHVSSEGELEQSFPLLEDQLNKGYFVEIIYTSPSVEKKILQLVNNWPKQIRYLRLPILTYAPSAKISVSQWMTSAILVMCRYDFFPELLLLKISENRKLVLISASTKSLIAGTLKYFYYSNIFKLFDFISTVNQLEYSRLVEKFHISPSRLIIGEYRALRISQRIARAPETLQMRIPQLKIGKKVDGLLFGSVYLDDLDNLDLSELLKKWQNKQIAIAFAPHDLSEKYSSMMLMKIREIFATSNVIVIDETFSGPIHKGNLYFCKMRGVLCELYSLFTHSYVGGGFHQQIHSVLEPFIAGCSIQCGPNVLKSTEFDLIKEICPDAIHKLELKQQMRLQSFIGNGEMRDFKEDHLIDSFYQLIKRYCL